MRINDSIFGELEYDYMWSRDIIINFGEKDIKISLMINGDEEGVFEEEQYIAYTSLMKKWSSLQEEILTIIKQKDTNWGMTLKIMKNIL